MRSQQQCLNWLCKDSPVSMLTNDREGLLGFELVDMAESIKEGGLRSQAYALHSALNSSFRR